MISGAQKFQSTTLQNDVVADMKFAELAAGSKSFPDSAVIWRRTVALVPSGLNREGAIWGCVLAPGQCQSVGLRLAISQGYRDPAFTSCLSGPVGYSIPAQPGSPQGGQELYPAVPTPKSPLIKHTPLKRQGGRWLPSGRQ